MTGDPTRDNAATPHDFAAPDVPWDDNDYRAARDRREAEQKQRMDAAHEKAKAERRPPCDCYDGYGIEADCPVHGEGEQA